MRTAAIILNWNNATETADCVRSLQAWTAPPQTIYVVDNASAPADVEALRELTGVTLIINDRNRGYSGGNNVGMRDAISDSHEAILLLNNDARITEADYSTLAETMEKDPSVAVAGPLIYDGDGLRLQNAGGRDIGLHYISHYSSPLDSNQTYDVDYVSGTVALFRVSVLGKVGLLDEDYFFSGEIADICKRIQRQLPGQRIVIDPHAKARHDLGISSDNRATLYTYYTVRNRYLYIRKHRLALLPVLFPYWMYRHLRHAWSAWRMQQKDSAQLILVGIYHGLKGRFGGFSEQ
ncbi:MAG: hypothetical protein DSZ32_05695 [Gammaproteobacteria bacterium]|nr:MAG: hypothetical protein DSZ32_05695 [Gammaproteobacteria bacterium]RTZ59873.1 MAG: hypothetical protein DSZ33_03675 [Gammaproteobacteria bacterium]